MSFPMEFFDGFVLAWGSMTNLIWLPRRQLWATFFICICPKWVKMKRSDAMNLADGRTLKRQNAKQQHLIMIEKSIKDHFKKFNY